MELTELEACIKLIDEKLNANQLPQGGWEIDGKWQGLIEFQHYLLDMWQSRKFEKL